MGYEMGVYFTNTGKALKLTCIIYKDLLQGDKDKHNGNVNEDGNGYGTGKPLTLTCLTFTSLLQGPEAKHRGNAKDDANNCSNDNNYHAAANYISIKKPLPF